MSTPRLTVVGAINIDITAHVSRAPHRGETVADGTLTRHPGGKGANQALAACRLGADTRLVGRVGDDELAALALGGLRAAGVDVSAVVRDSSAPTGIAVVTVDDDGENHIVVASGANANVTAHDVRALAGDVRDRGVLCQLELGDEAITAAARLENRLLCINAAPARSLPSEVWDRAGLVIVNEIERAQLGGELDRFDGLLATTLGAEGARLIRSGEEVARARSPRVAVVDTTGAGDAFAGALVVGLLEGRSDEDALARASAAGALATTKQGAQAGLPTAAEIDKLLA